MWQLRWCFNSNNINYILVRVGCTCNINIHHQIDKVGSSFDTKFDKLIQSIHFSNCPVLSLNPIPIICFKTFLGWIWISFPSIFTTIVALFQLFYWVNKRTWEAFIFETKISYSKYSNTLHVVWKHGVKSNNLLIVRFVKNEMNGFYCIGF